MVFIMFYNSKFYVLIEALLVVREVPDFCL